MWPNLFILQVKNIAQRNKVICPKPYSYLMGETKFETCFWSPLLPFFIHAFFKKHVLFIPLVLEVGKILLSLGRSKAETLRGQ